MIAWSTVFFSSTDEIIMENVLQSMQTFSSLCGQLEINTARDAFITAICKASLPPHYALSMLNIATPSLNRSTIKILIPFQNSNWVLLKVTVTTRSRTCSTTWIRTVKMISGSKWWQSAPRCPRSLGQLEPSRGLWCSPPKICSAWERFWASRTATALFSAPRGTWFSPLFR